MKLDTAEDFSDHYPDSKYVLQLAHLGCSLLIACCAIYLSCKEKPLNKMRLEGSSQLTGVQKIILNSIA